MKPTVPEAARQLEERGLLTRTRADQSAGIIDHVREAPETTFPRSWRPSTASAFLAWAISMRSFRRGTIG